MSDISSGQAPTRIAPDGQQPPTKTKLAELSLPPDLVAEILRQHGLPDAKAGIVIEQITELQRHHSGPLPTVEDFRGYEEACKGAARDIVDMAVRQQKHYHWVEKADVLAGILLPILGLVAAVSAVVAMLATGVYLAMNGHENLAVAVFSGTGIATIAGAFLQRVRAKKVTEPPQQTQKKINKPRRKK